MSLAPLPEVYVPTINEHAEVKDPELPRGLDPKATGDDVQLLCNDLRISGWERVLIVRGIEIMPSTFDIQLTEKYPGEAASIDIAAGDRCQVYIGTTLVLSGYIDRRMSSIGPEGNIVRVTGRSFCQDLVDCSIDPAQLPNMQIGQATVLTVAQRLAGQYGINVQQIGEPNFTVLPQINPALGTTPFSVIEEICRYTAQLCYDEVDGSLNIAAVNVGLMASGFSEGWNIESAQAMQSMDMRYSDIEVFLTSSNSFQEAGALPALASVIDKTVPRLRKLVIISEQAQLGDDFATQRGKWEVARRWGRSQVCTLTADSWRDSAGTLWHVNCTALLNVPHLKLKDKVWLISQVSFRRDESGTHADVVMMPPGAFIPQPNILLPYDAEIYKAMHPGGGSAAANPDQNTR